MSCNTPYVPISRLVFLASALLDDLGNRGSVNSRVSLQKRRGRYDKREPRENNMKWGILGSGNIVRRVSKSFAMAEGPEMFAIIKTINQIRRVWH